MVNPIGKRSSRHYSRFYFTVADLYIVLFDAIVTNPGAVGHGREGYYFGENGEHSWYSISQAIGEALVELGISSNPKPTIFTDAEVIEYFGSLVRVSNC